MTSVAHLPVDLCEHLADVGIETAVLATDHFSELADRRALVGEPSPFDRKQVASSSCQKARAIPRATMSAPVMKPSSTSTIARSPAGG